MVGVFRRSLSFNPSRPSTSRPAISHHTRSISLPCRPHPAISHLRETTSEIVNSWSTSPDGRSSAWLTDGLARLKSLHDSLDDALNLPQTRDSLRRQPPAKVEKLLDDFLRFADAFGIFRTLIISLREDHSSASVAVRRRDQPTANSYVRARKKLAKEMRALISAVREISAVPEKPAAVCVGDGEVMAAMDGVVEATAAVSLAVFGAICGTKRERRVWGRIRESEEGVIGELEGAEKAVAGLRKKTDDEIRKASKTMNDVEACIAAVEAAGEAVFRGLIASRVSLLNTFTR